MSIWDFETYRAYLLERLGAQGTRSGVRKRLAAAIPVHTTFISQVMSGEANLSAEQAEAVNGFFDHTDAEGEYFLLLVLRDRAGTEALRARLARKIGDLRQRRINVKSRLDAADEISEADRQRYYSSHLYAAVHVLCAIPQFATVDALADVLRQPRSQIREIVDFLVRTRAVIETAGVLSPGSRHVHLGTDSELVLRHHANWRLHAVSRMQLLDREDLHYSACVSLAAADAFKIKDGLLANLKTQVDVISNSPEEVAYVLNLDFYKLT